MREALKVLEKADMSKFKKSKQANNYRRGRGFGRSMRKLASMIKADIGIEVAFVDIGGWDHHTGESARLTNLLGQFGQTLAAFYKDLGDKMEDVVVLTMSEFGRTARENGNAGTDHGHANAMILMGGSVKGGKVYGEWPGLAREQLNENRDLAMTTDFRDVFCEVLVNHLGCKNTDAVFPKFATDAKRFKGMI